MKCCVLLLITFIVRGYSLIAPVKNANGEIDVSSLSSHVLLLEQMYSGLSAKYESKFAEVDNKFNSVSAELMSVKLDLQGQLRNITGALAKMKTPVSFEVLLSVEVYSILDHEVLKFDTVIMNEGNSYSKTSGIFTAPVSGTYLFWIHVDNHQNQSLDIHIIKEGKYVVRAYTDNVGTVASATALFHLTKGEQVWFIKSSGSSEIYGHSLSSYGGVLLFAH